MRNVELLTVDRAKQNYSSAVASMISSLVAFTHSCRPSLNFTSDRPGSVFRQRLLKILKVNLDQFAIRIFKFHVPAIAR